MSSMSIKSNDLTQKIVIGEKNWEHVTMEFMVGLPHTTRKFDSIWVIIDRLTKFRVFYTSLDYLLFGDVGTDSYL